MKNNIYQEPLKQLIKEAGMEEPSAEFSRRLAEQVVKSCTYWQIAKAPVKNREWVGLVIIFVLIALNALMLLTLDPFRTQPVLCWAIGGFIFAFCCILVWVKKQKPLSR